MRKPRESLALKPKVDFDDVGHAWFRYMGNVYPVASAPSDVFRAAVLQKAPNWRESAEYWKVLKQAELDRYDQWWLLNGLADTHRAIMLYESRESAEQASRQVAG
jgi:hypothetical protein